MNADSTRTAWTPANKDVILVAAERRPCRSSRNLGLSQQKNEEEKEGEGEGEGEGEEEEEEEEEEKIRRKSQRCSERYYIHYGEGVAKYFAEGSQAGFIRPSGKGRLEAM